LSPTVPRVALTASILLVSVLLHLGLLGVIVLAERRGTTTAERDAIEVELVTAPEMPEPPKPEPPKVEPPKPEPPKPELPNPEPQKQAEQPKPEPKPAEQPKPEPQAAPAPPPKPAEQPPVSTARVSPQDQPQAAEPESKPPAPSEGPSGGPSESKSKLTPEEIAAFRAQVQRCWTLPLGLPDAMKLEAILRVRLERNGALSSSPELLKANASAGGPVLVGIAMKALQECGPYRVLPVTKYAEWRVLDLRFLATGMTGLGAAQAPPRPRPAG
jgi:outer membrane biosynthesis protein TonB